MHLNTYISVNTMNIAFFIRHFTERGTEVAIYDYAKYNEDILNNKSYIVCFTERKQSQLGMSSERVSYDKFKQRFQIIEICDIGEMDYVIQQFNISYFYTLTHGCSNDIYQFENKNLWGKCKTIKHCVFDTRGQEGDFYIGISDFLNLKYNTTVPIIPHIVEFPTGSDNLRTELQIPQDAIVFGRYGGFTEFNLVMAHQAIIDFLNSDNNSESFTNVTDSSHSPSLLLRFAPNTWFIFMNTQKFYEHPRIIYLEKNVDLIFKTKFINTCNAMIHAREEGETFGLSIAEFSIKNKPVITCPSGDLEHIKILGDKAVLYRSKDELLNIFNNIENIIKNKDDWNAYRAYTPENVMQLFNELIFSS